MNDLKAQVCLLKTEIVSLKTKDLEIEAKLSILEPRKNTQSTLPTLELDISRIPDTKIPENQFLQTISHVTFQKWYSIVKLVVNDFSINTVALIAVSYTHLTLPTKRIV